MKSLLFHPRWLFLSVSTPQFLLLVIYYKAFQVFGFELDEEIQIQWFLYGISLLGLVLGQTIYAFWCSYHTKLLSWRWALPTIIMYVLLIASYLSQDSSLVPRDIPNWIQSVTNVTSFIPIFIFPVLLHAIIIGTFSFTNSNAQLKFLDAGSLLIPILIYLFILIGPIIGSELNSKEEKFILVLFIFL